MNAVNPEKDLEPVGMVASVPLILVSSPKLPVTTLEGLIELAKTKPGQLNYASVGNGSPQQLAAELFQMMAGVKMTHIPYKGGSQAMVSLMGGQVQLMFNNTPEVLPQMSSGRLKVLAIASPQRLPLMPDIPTVAEAGLPDFSVSLWYGLMGAKGIPQPIVEKLNSAVRTALVDPEVIAKLANLGAQPLIQTTQQFAEVIKNDSAKWAEVIKAGNIKPD
jgi:tripartite-type tricarboxylate transporter receptor subunit TctC